MKVNMIDFSGIGERVSIYRGVFSCHESTRERHVGLLTDVDSVVTYLRDRNLVLLHSLAGKKKVR